MLTIITAGLLAVAPLSTASPTYSARTDTIETELLPEVTGSVWRLFYDDTVSFGTRPDTIDLYGSYSVQPPMSSRGHGWLRFDLSTLPDSAEFDAARLHFYVFYESGGPHELKVTGFLDYTGAEDSLYWTVSNSDSLSMVADCELGWNSAGLNSTGLQLLRAGLAEDQAFVGIAYQPLDGTAIAYGLHGGPDSLRPYIELSYHTAVNEAPGPCPQASSFRTYPNPAPARSRVRLSLPAAHPADISVHDITGREVWTKRLAGDRSDTVQLPLLPAGVYLIRLQSGSLTATGKLVVQR